MSTEPEPSRLSYADPFTPRAEHHGTTLTRRDLSALAVKLIGLYLIVQAIPAVVGIAGWILDGAPRSGIGYYLGNFGFFVGLGLVLIAMGDRIGAWLLSDPAPVPSEPAAPDIRNVQAAAFAVVGVMLIAVWALPGFFYDGWRYLYGTRPASASERLRELRPLLVRHTVELVLGLLLFYGSKRLAAYWHRLRSRGHSQANNDEGPL